MQEVGLVPFVVIPFGYCMCSANDSEHSWICIGQLVLYAHRIRFLLIRVETL